MKIEPGDMVIPSNRSEPLRITAMRIIDDYEGSIYVKWECRCTGPRGAQIRIQRTSTGRLRMSGSKYGVFANIDAIYDVDHNEICVNTKGRTPHLTQNPKG